MTKTMTQSLQIPAFGFSDDMDCTGLFELRRELKQQVPGLTVLPFFMKALSLALTKFPEVNAIVNPDLDSEGYIHEYVVKHDHNFSVAIDSPLGLTTPNIKRVQE
jgi:2-oxoisovalerate dehydrogenase E2 component (dihydrolipoyl transacylase)